MKNKSIVLAVVIGVLVLGILVLNTSSKRAGQTIVLGATLPLSGDLAFLGEGYRNGMNLALKELSGTTNHYSVIFEDDKFDPKIAASTANKLISIDHVQGLFSFGSPVGNVVSPLAESSKVVHINGIASDPTVAKGEYNFVHWTPPYEESKLLMAEMLKRNITKVAVMVTNQPGTLAVANQIKADLAQNNLVLADYELFNPGDKDMRTQIVKSKGASPDIYILIATSPELEIVTKQIKEQGIKTPLTSIESFEFTQEPKLYESMWYVNAADPTPDFVAKYKKEYGATPPLGAANGYDAVNLFVKAVESTQGTVTEEKIKDALLSIKNYDGAVGTLSVDKDGLIVSQAVVRMIKDGKPVTIPN